MILINIYSGINLRRQRQKEKRSASEEANRSRVTTMVLDIYLRVSMSLKPLATLILPLFLLPALSHYYSLLCFSLLDLKFCPHKYIYDIPTYIYITTFRSKQHKIISLMQTIFSISRHNLTVLVEIPTKATQENEKTMYIC